jgi:hypothetical protein
MNPILTIEPGTYPLWEGFSLVLEYEIPLLAGQCYHLQGANGSGKSSFIRRALIPALVQNSVPYIYIEQQMRSQLFALMADASLKEYSDKLHTESDAIDYLLSGITSINQALVCICDESAHNQKVHTALAKSGKDFALIIVSHEHIDLDCVLWKISLDSPLFTRLEAL